MAKALWKYRVETDLVLEPEKLNLDIIVNLNFKVAKNAYNYSSLVKRGRKNARTQVSV